MVVVDSCLYIHVDQFQYHGGSRWDGRYVYDRRNENLVSHVVDDHSVSGRQRGLRLVAHLDDLVKSEGNAH